MNGDYFLAMEYVHGQPLSRVMRRAQALQFPFLPEAIALQIGIGLCKGLHYAHTRVDEAGQPLHIVHHDVSPQNVLVGYDGEVKVVDFGIARARHATDSAMQASGVKGKYPYFSPEQARGEPVDLRTDIYATGVVLYQMLCGRLPHEGKMVQTMQSIARGEFPAPRSLNPASRRPGGDVPPHRHGPRVRRTVTPQPRRWSWPWPPSSTPSVRTPPPSPTS